MPPLSAEDRARVETALRAYCAAGEELTISGYARAAGVKRETARAYCLRLGLPFASDQVKVPPETAAERAEDRPPAKRPDEPPVPPSTVTPPKPAARPSLPQVHPPPDPLARMDRTEAMMGQLPAAIAAEVRDVLSKIVAVQGRDVDQAAIDAARSSVAHAHVDSVTKEAAEIHTHDAEAGEEIRRYWLRAGLREEFASPGALAKAALDFWWSNRDVIAGYREQLDAAWAEIESLRARLDPANRRREAREQVYVFALGMANQGRPLSEQFIAESLLAADRLALDWTDVTPSPPPELADGRG